MGGDVAIVVHGLPFDLANRDVLADLPGRLEQAVIGGPLGRSDTPVRVKVYAPGDLLNAGPADLRASIDVSALGYAPKLDVLEALATDVLVGLCKWAESCADPLIRMVTVTIPKHDMRAMHEAVAI